MNLERYLSEPIPIAKEISSFLNKNDEIIIFDVGCCEGEDTIRYHIFFPNCKIYSFEPHPENFSKTKNNLKKYNIDSSNVYNLALSDSESVLDFYVSEGHPNNLPKSNDWDYGNKSSSILPSKELHQRYDWLRLNNVIKVNSTTLDNFCKKNAIEKIDLLHLDVQGAEILVLTGGKNIIKSTKLVWLEAETVELYENQPLKNDVIDFMSSINFKKIKEVDNYLSSDILFVNENKYI